MTMPDTIEATPYLPENPRLRRFDLWLRRKLAIESGSNIFPLLHVFAYYAVFAVLAVPGLVQGPAFAILFAGMLILNYSLSIGIQHLHAHRKLFNHPAPNRVLEFLLGFPSVLSYPMMLYTHVQLHHRHENGPGDPTATAGYEKGWRAVFYWLRYPFVCQSETIQKLFEQDPSPRWRKLKRQYLIDTLAPIGLVTAYFFVVDPLRAAIIWTVPMILVNINIGFFAWMTHAPARGDTLSGSINHVCRWQNLLIHNQGFHVAHHLYPGIHWTRLPDALDALENVDDRFIVGYTVFLPSALRNADVSFFHQAAVGRVWKARYRRKKLANTVRLAACPYFCWI